MVDGVISEADLDREMSLGTPVVGKRRTVTLRSLITLLQSTEQMPFPVTGLGHGSTLDWIRYSLVQ